MRSKGVWVPSRRSPCFHERGETLHLNGIPFDQAPIPRRLHICKPQTMLLGRGGTSFCACGATQENNRWTGRNRRDRENTTELSPPPEIPEFVHAVAPVSALKAGAWCYATEWAAGVTPQAELRLCLDAPADGERPDGPSVVVGRRTDGSWYVVEPHPDWEAEVLAPDRSSRVLHWVAADLVDDVLA